MNQSKELRKALSLALAMVLVSMAFVSVVSANKVSVTLEKWISPLLLRGFIMAVGAADACYIKMVKLKWVVK
jgi:hypothetical protein